MKLFMFLLTCLVTNRNICSANICMNETTEVDFFVEKCSDEWKGERAFCYRLPVAKETWNTRPIDCFGFALDLDKARASSEEEKTSTKPALFLGAYRNTTEHYTKDTNWIWITGTMYNDASIWQSNYNGSAFERNCSYVLMVTGTYYCDRLPCARNCSFPCQDSCKNYTFGSMAMYGIYTLQETKYDERVRLRCYYNPDVEMEAHCIQPWNATANAQWNIINQEKCWSRSRGIANLAKLKVDTSNILNVTRLIRNWTHEAKTLNSFDIGNISTILDGISNVKSLLDNICFKIVEAVKRFSEKFLFPGEDQPNGTDLSNLAVSKMAVKSGRTSRLTLSANSTFVSAGFTADENPDMKNFNITLTLPKELFAEKDQTTVLFVLYRRTIFFLKTKQVKARRRIRSYVIAASVQRKEIKNLKEDIVVRYQDSERIGVSKATCAFWDFKADENRGEWSNVGCKYRRNNYDECHCNHLTNFAMLLDVKPDANQPYKKSLSIISYVGCSVSLSGIVLTIVTMFYFKGLLANKSSKIFLNICIALALGLAVFLAAAERRKIFSNIHCVVAGMTNHYFFLAALAWMVLEAYTMYLAFVKVLPKVSVEGRIPSVLICCLICWGIPAVIVGATAFVAMDSYGNEEYCLLQGLPLLGAFFVPVAICVFINTSTFAFILRSLLRSGGTIASTKKTSGVEQARRGVTISVFLGLTWISGVLAIGDAKVFFQYVFCITSSLQGCMIFLFYCVFSTEVRRKFLEGFYKKTSSEAGARGNGGTSEDPMKVPKQTFSRIDGPLAFQVHSITDYGNKTSVLKQWHIEKKS